MESQQVHEIVEERSIKDGQNVLVQTIKAPTYDATGKVNGIQISFWDITDRRRAEEEILLRDRALAASVNGVIIVSFKLNKPVYVNDALLKMTGYTREESMNLTYLDILGDLEDFKEMQSIINTQGFYTSEKSIKCKDGSLLPTNFSSAIIKDENGQPIAIQSSFFDISERKHAEQALKESEERFRSLYDNATIGLYRTTPDGQILMINPTGLRMLGFDTFEEMAKRNLEQSGFEEVDARKKFREKLEREGIIEQESVWKKKDGTSIVVRESSTVSRDENGKILYYNGSFEDITAYKQAEKGLHESEERFRRFTEATNEGLVFHEQGKIIDANPAGLTMFGLSDQTDFIGRNLMEFVAPEFHQMVLKQMQLENVSPYEIQCIRKDLSTFPVETSTRTYKIGDRTVRATSIRDITKRKQAETELRQSELRLSNAISIARMGYWDLDIDTQMFIFNDQYYRTFHGTTTEEMGGNQMSVMDFIQRFIPPGEGDVIGNGMQEAIETKDPNFQQKLEAKNLTVKGELRWVSVWLTVEKDEHGRTIKLHGVNQDITERKQLEAQVQEALERRGHQVQISTEISQEVAAASKLDELLERVVTLTKERLGYYHTQLLRYDPSEDAVVLVNGYGETGRKMLEDSHKMPMGAGLIGTAATTGETVMRPNLANDPDWHPNPLLPETKGEIAVPIKWQDTVLGVLDVQSDQAGALAEDDRLLLEGLCGQIAIAMHSAELVETVRENEARLAEALKAARLGNWEYDFEHDLFEFSDDFYSIFRTTAEKVGGYKVSSADYAKNFVHPDDAPLVGIEIQKVLDAKDRLFTTHLEHRIIFADGEIGYIAVNINVERDENGKITRWYGANQDITERKQAENALAEALKIARLAYWEYDVEKDIFTFNDQFYSIFRTTAEQHGGYQLSSGYYAEHFVYPDDLPVVGAEIAKALNSTERHYSRTIDHRVLFGDGNIGYIQVNINVDRDENGKITRYYGANQDITERKQAEELLRINDARLAEALQIARLAYWEYDVEKDIFTFNDQFYSIFHTTAEQHGGYQLSSAYYAQHFVYPDDLPIVGAEIEKALTSTERHYSRDLEHRILYADGGIGHISVNINVDRDENGKITRYYGANQDITERRKAQEEMAERLEEINRLYRSMSQEGWKTYRATADLPKGFMFDQASVKPVDDIALTDGRFAQVPMKVLGGEVVGNLSIADDPQHPISEDDLQFLEQVSDQVALALEGARLAAQTQSALAQSEVLFDASRRLAQTSDLQELLKIALDTFNIPVINGAELNVFNYDSEGELESLNVAANWWNGTGKEPGAVGSHYPKAIFPSVKLFLTSTPVFIRDALNSERVDADMLRIVKAFNIRAAIFLPLYTGTHQTGVLVMHAEEPHEFTEEETRLFTGLAPQIATVLENRRQFERAQQQAERETTLNLISQKIQSATTVEAVLQIAARELGHALGAPMTIAQLSMKDRK
jgi:PAS domain S-box-containing protein